MNLKGAIIMRKKPGDSKESNKEFHGNLSEDCLFFGLAEKFTEEQKDYVNSIYSDNYDIVFCNSPSGSGKTTLAVAAAKMLVAEKRYEGLVYVFTPVEENKMGFRPGTQVEKENAYTLPLKQALIEIGEQPEKAIMNVEDAKAMKEGSYWVETMSEVFARGINLKNKVIIIDEAQNWTVDQLRKLLTRCHDSCKIIVIGHTGQIDLLDKSSSGFKKYINHYEPMPRAKVCVLTKNFRGWVANHADALPA
jgi:phosphate starvation-inducible protein PhoH